MCSYISYNCTTCYEVVLWGIFSISCTVYWLRASDSKYVLMIHVLFISLINSSMQHGKMPSSPYHTFEGHGKKWVRGILTILFYSFHWINFKSWECHLKTLEIKKWFPRTLCGLDVARLWIIKTYHETRTIIVGPIKNIPHRYNKKWCSNSDLQSQCPYLVVGNDTRCYLLLLCTLSENTDTLEGTQRR